MKQESQFIIGNWAIGLHARPHVTVEFNSVNQFVLKALTVLKVSLTRNFVGQTLKMINQIRKYAFVMMFRVRLTGMIKRNHRMIFKSVKSLFIFYLSGGLVHGNCALAADEMVNHFQWNDVQLCA